MCYTQGQKEELEEVLRIFADYIRQSKYVDVVWSEKLGYVLLKVNLEMRDIEMAPIVLEDAKMLCKELFDEITQDVLDLTGNDHDKESADALERAEIERRLEKYTKQLPQYQELVEQCFIKSRD